MNQTTPEEWAAMTAKSQRLRLEALALDIERLAEKEEPH